MVWLYFRFSLSFRNVEDLMAQRGVDVSYETIRSWTQKFGRLFADSLRKSRAAPSVRWHLDEMVVAIAGERMFLWRAVDDEGVVLDMLDGKGTSVAFTCPPACPCAATEYPTPYFKPHGPTPGALQGDDYPLTYDAHGYPELPAFLDLRLKPHLAKAA